MNNSAHVRFGSRAPNLFICCALNSFSNKLFTAIAKCNICHISDSYCYYFRFWFCHSYRPILVLAPYLSFTLSPSTNPLNFSFNLNGKWKIHLQMIEHIVFIDTIVILWMYLLLLLIGWVFYCWDSIVFVHCTRRRRRRRRWGLWKTGKILNFAFG